ncbi:hypothetical protein [Mycobacterium hubeiense]|uniref:hypothetical protein n=1 Tax=Mycobacterium hubeiense TaxID=1867256 RepID=UPI000C7F4185|nr:hypothetical protein [Mycobacterium sp. QGD 101]
MTLEDESQGLDGWYVATYLGYDTVNYRPFAKVRGPGQRITSWSRRGFRIFRQPTDINHFGVTHKYLPWLRFWKVQPVRLIGYEQTVELRWASEDPTVCRARTIEVVEEMPDGFEFGVCGPALKQLMHRMAEMYPLPEAPPWGMHQDYDAAISPLRAGRTTIPSVEWEIEKQARECFLQLYLHTRNRERSAGDSRHWARSVHDSDANALLDGVLNDGVLPADVLDYWDLADWAPSRREGGRPAA